MRRTRESERSSMHMMRRASGEAARTQTIFIVLPVEVRKALLEARSLAEVLEHIDKRLMSPAPMPASSRST